MTILQHDDVVLQTLVPVAVRPGPSIRCKCTAIEKAATLTVGFAIEGGEGHVTFRKLKVVPYTEYFLIIIMYVTKIVGLLRRVELNEASGQQTNQALLQGGGRTSCQLTE